MKIKKYAMILVCFGAILLSALSFQNSTSYEGSTAADVGLTLDDFFTLALADGEGSNDSCKGSTCSDANDHKYTALTTPDGVTCCGVQSPLFRGEKKS
jgi:hypothetical protein